jgi:PST family polysaccharide transporter
MKSFRERTLSGALWSVTSQGGRQAIMLVSNLVLARLLTPHDFGLVATVLIFVNFAIILAEQGFGAALIQRKDVTEEHLSTIHWVNVALGGAFTALLFFGAPVIARIFDEEALIPLTRAMSWIFAINSLGMVHTTLLTRELSFRSLAKVEVASAWFGGAASIYLAWRGWGPMSIAVQSIVAAVVGVLVLRSVSEWRPRVLFRWSAVRDLAEFSVNSFIGSVTHYWVRNVDNVLVGYVLGQGPLGVYTRAYSVMLFPLSRVSRVLSRVMFPSLSMIQGDRPLIRRMFLKMTRAIALVTFPVMLGVAASAGNFTAVVFGPQWGEMVPILRILAVVGMVQSVTALIGNIYMSQNETGLRLRVILPIQAAQVLGIVLGLKWGILGVSIGYAVATLATAPVECYYAGILIGMSVSEFVSNLRAVFFCSAASALAVAGLGALLPPGTSVFAGFGLQVLAGAAVYTALLHAFSVKSYGEMLGVVRDVIARRRAA